MDLIRPYIARRDFLRLYRYLESENIHPIGMVFDRDTTFVSDDGFYTYRVEHHNTQPWLIHFYIEPDKRSYPAAYRMYQHFKGEMKKRGFNSFVATVPDDKQYLRNFMKLSGACVPYARKNDMDFYKIVIKEG
jgi:hypothetical protein